MHVINRKYIENSIIVIVFISLLSFAWYNRFIQDDAYISFRYAENLINGHGLVWNPGERVEGYSNFLWTVIIALAMKVGFQAPESSIIIGLVLFSGSLLMCFRISMVVFSNNKKKALAVLLLTGSNYTFSCYATGGLETQLQVFLLLCACMLFLNFRVNYSLINGCVFSTILAFGILNRMDFAIFSSILLCASAFSVLKRNDSGRGKIKLICTIIVPLVMIVLPWCIWKLIYYGDIFPNTYYVKIGSSNSYLVGIEYVYHFLKSYYGFFSAIGILSILLLYFIRKTNNIFFIFLLMVILWTLYIVKISGCTMEFRLFTPIIPILMILSIWLFFDSGMIAKKIGIVFVMVILAGSIMHMVNFKQSAGTGITPINNLNDIATGWALIGQQLQKDLQRDSIIIATTAAGAIPFYYKGPAIDMHGLNDHWIAHNGVIWGNMPGHQRGATVEYLLKRNVNLVIAHPLWVHRNDTENYWKSYAKQMVKMWTCRSKKFVGKYTASFILIPIEYTEYNIAVWYLTKSPEMDTICKKNSWKIHEIPVQISEFSQVDKGHPDFKTWLSRLESTSIVPKLRFMTD